MSQCPSRCYDNGGRVAGSDSNVEFAHATVAAIVPCSPCGAGAVQLFGAVGDNMFAVSGRVAVNSNNQIFYALSASPNDPSNNSLPYTLIGDTTIASLCWLAPFAGTASNLWARADSIPIGDGNTRTFTVYLGRPGVADSAPTALSVFFNQATNVMLSDVGNTFDFEAGDLLSMGIAIAFDGEADQFDATFSVQIDVAAPV